MKTSSRYPLFVAVIFDDKGKKVQKVFFYRRDYRIIRENCNDSLVH